MGGRSNACNGHGKGRSVEGGSRRWHRAQELPTRPGAGQYHLVDFTFADPCKHPDIAAGLGDVVRRYRLCRVARKLMKAVKYRMQLRERVEGAMGSLRKLNGLRRSEQPLDEAIQLLAANQGDLREAVSAFWDLDPDQSKRLAAFLMPGEPIPQPHHQGPQ